MLLDKESAKRDRSLLAEALQQAGATNTHRNAIRCPFHDDKHPSAQIKQAPSGCWNFYCYACSISEDVFGIRARNEGRDVAEILKENFPASNGNGNGNGHKPKSQPAPPPAEKPKPKQSFPTANEAWKAFKEWKPKVIHQATYRYDDPETGECDYCVIRYLPGPNEDKKFLPLHRRDDGRWYMEHPPVLPLYNRKGIHEAHSVLMLEGEKCVDLFHELLDFDGIVASTCPQGSNGVGKTDLTPLAGKAVYVLRDFDAPGETWSNTLIEKLLSLEPHCQIARVRVEDLGLPPKGDLEQILQMFPGTRAEQTDLVQVILEAGEPMNAIAPLVEQFRLIREGKYKNIHFPKMPVLSHLSKALLPGTVTALCGDPGARKSWMMLEWSWRWTLETDVKVKIMMMEDKEDLHQRRVLTQMEGDSNIADIDKHQLNPEKYDAVLERNAAQLEKWARQLVCMKSEQLTLTEIGDWIIEQCERGIDVIIVDPITAAKAEPNPWVADSTFVFRVKAAVEKHGARLILVTHPRGNTTKPGLGGLAGGLAFPRFSQNVLWLQHFDNPQESMVSLAEGYSVKRKHHLALQIRKARSGPGSGRHLAVQMDPHTLCFEEIGIIQT